MRIIFFLIMVLLEIFWPLSCGKKYRAHIAEDSGYFTVALSAVPIFVLLERRVSCFARAKKPNELVKSQNSSQVLFAVLVMTPLSEEDESDPGSVGCSVISDTVQRQCCS